MVTTHKISELTTGSEDGFAKDATVSFEFFPPKTPEGEKSLWAAVDRLYKFNPKFMTVTYGAGGTTRDLTKSLVMKIQQNTGIPTASHLTCVGAPQSEVDDLARLYWAIGIKHIVALRGDMPGGGPFAAHPEGYAGSIEMIEGIRKIAPFEVSVAAYPEKHPSAPSFDKDIDVLKRKFDAGAERAITQYFFEPTTFIRFLDMTAKAGITKPIVPGIMPIGNFAQVVKFSQQCGASIPQNLHDTFSGLENDPDTTRLIAAITAVEQCRVLYAMGVRHFHFYTMNRHEIIYAICHMLGLRPSVGGGSAGGTGGKGQRSTMAMQAQIAANRGMGKF